MGNRNGASDLARSNKYNGGSVRRIIREAGAHHNPGLCARAPLPLRGNDHLIIGRFAGAVVVRGCAGERESRADIHLLNDE